ncbi:MAG: thioredoxin family protein [Bdellovibrionaceae bacterium]|nr:thioredoxin family protein [Pseudobdellovibrionaceae bacterium]
MKPLLRLFLSLMFAMTALTGTLVHAQSAGELDPLLAEVSLSLYEWNPGQSGDVTIKLKLPEGYHAYEDMFRLKITSPDDFKMAPFKLINVVNFYDKFSKKNRRGVQQNSSMTAHIEAPLQFVADAKKLKFELTYQVCSDSFCLFPVTKKLETSFKLVGAPAGATISSSDAPMSSIKKEIFSQDFFAETLAKGGFLVFVLAFLAGILTSFTPCIFPMIPITLAILGNDAEKRSRLQNFLNSCIYVLGIATTYSLIGLAAASSGALFGASLGNPYVLTVICIVFFAMSLSMYGLYEIQVPAFIRQKFGGRVNTRSFHLTTYLTGMFAGIVASPCVGPVLVTILTYVATHQNKVLGFFLLFTYAVGMGLIFLVLGLSNQVTRLLPRSGPWMDGVKFILGSLMLGAFYYYLDLLVSERWFDAALGAGLLTIGSVFGAFVAAKKPTEGLRKGLMLATMLIGVGYLAVGIFNLRPVIEHRYISEEGIAKSNQLEWQPYSEELLKKAAQDKKPVIIDFWAEWCAACHELEQFTFTDPEVRELSKNFVLLKFDATKTSSELSLLKEKYKIQGLPTLIFYGKEGDWLEGLTLMQFEKAPKFLQRLNKARN